MARAKTSQKQRKSAKTTRKWDRAKLSACREWSPTNEILEPDNLAKAVAECLLNNDPDGIVEIIQIYLETVNVVKFAKTAHISKSTLYHSLKEKNPTIKTLAKLIHAAAA
jgi:DNA-binding phage protein